MRNIFEIALNDLRIFFSERGNIISLTVVPIFMSIALGIAFGGTFGGNTSISDEPIKYRMDIVDNDKSSISLEFIDNLSESENLIVCPFDDNCALPEPVDELTIDMAIARLNANDTISAVVIPENFEAELQAFNEVSMTYYTNETLQTGNPVGSIVSATIERMNSAFVAGRVGVLIASDLGGFESDSEQEEFRQNVYSRATELIDDNPLVIRYILTEEGEQTGSDVGTGFGQSIPGIGAMQVLFTVLAGLVTLIRDRKQWTLQRLTVMPLTRSEILGGKILMYFTLGMIQYAILLAVGLLVGVNYGDSILALLILVSAFVLCSTALTFALATRVTSEGQANSLATLLGLVLAPLGGAWWPLAIVPDFMYVVGHISPVAWVMGGFNDLIFFGGGLVEILPEVGVLLVASVVLFIIGVRGFQFGD